MYEMCMWYVWDLYVICMRYVWDVFVICMRSVCDMYEICMWYVWDLCVICMRCESYHREHIEVTLSHFLQYHPSVPYRDLWQLAQAVCTAVDAWFICCTDFTLHFVIIVLASHHSLNISNKSIWQQNISNKSTDHQN